MFGLAYVPKEQGILLTVRKNSGLQPDTASYKNLNEVEEIEKELEEEEDEDLVIQMRKIK